MAEELEPLFLELPLEAPPPPPKPPEEVDRGVVVIDLVDPCDG